MTKARQGNGPASPSSLLGVARRRSTDAVLQARHLGRRPTRIPPRLAPVRTTWAGPPFLSPRIPALWQFALATALPLPQGIHVSPMWHAAACLPSEALSQAYRRTLSPWEKVPHKNSASPNFLPNALGSAIGRSQGRMGVDVGMTGQGSRLKWAKGQKNRRMGGKRHILRIRIDMSRFRTQV